MNKTQENILAHISAPIFSIVGSVADDLNRECYVVGGYVRDIFFFFYSKDIDFVTVGSGIEVAKHVATTIGRKKSHLAVFKTYGTAQVKTQGIELEFVGARRESYNRNSRNPIVEDGTLHDDQCRRDFTINAMAISVNKASWGKLLDPFDGIGDLERQLIRTPLDPDITFSDDPLRMMRAIRFATQLGFEIEQETFKAIKRNAQRLKIITRERIADELMKIMRSSKPSRGFFLLDKCGLLSLVCPELDQLKGVDIVNGRGHKDNFLHTMQVLDNVAAQSDNEWLRWAALFHDIGKPATQRWMRLPLNEHMKYVKKLVGLHMRPIALVEDEVTDSAVRRMIFEAGDDIDDLMTLCHADITSKNQEKVKRIHQNYELVKQKIIDIEEKDRVRNFQPPVDGKEIMDTFGLTPSRPVGDIKDAIKDAILDGVIRNDYAQAHHFMMNKAKELGITAEYQINKDLYEEINNGFFARSVDELKEYFARERHEFSLPLHIVGTEFQKSVWEAIRTVTYSKTASYKQIALMIGKEKSVRAVAQACGANRLPIIIPCHRIIASNGDLGGYSAGVDKKEFLLKLEGTLK